MSSNVLTDGWDLPLHDAHQILATVRGSMILSIVPGESAAPTTRIASRSGTQWLWHPTQRIALEIDDVLIAGDQVVVDGDRFCARHIVTGKHREGTMHLDAASPRIRFNRPMHDQGERSLENWREREAWTGVAHLRPRGGWLVFPGPGGRTRAIERSNPTRGCAYVVAAEACARREDIVDALASGACVVRSAGITSLKELLRTTAAQRASIDAAVALDVIRRLDERAADFTSVSVDAEGALYVHSNDRAAMSPSRLGNVLCVLLGVRTLSADVLDTIPFESSDMKQAMHRLITLADSSTNDSSSNESFRTALAAVPGRSVRAAELGDVVRGLFPERVAQERAMHEQLETLDEESVLALMR